MSKRESVSAFKVATTYIGTIIGAGFATGQEVLQFFTRFGVQGLMGLLLATIMYILFGLIIMDIGRKVNARSHLEVITYSGGRFFGSVIDWIITFFLFAVLTAMLAGTGALFTQQYGLPGILGNTIMALIVAITVLKGINGVINSISFVTPFLIIAVIGTSIISILRTPPNIFAIQAISPESVLITNWPMAAILFVSYNLVIAVAVLGPLGAQAHNSKAIRNGASLGGLSLGLGATMIFLALSGNIHKVAELEVPMIYVAQEISPALLIIYTFVLITAIYTTAAVSLYGFVSRLTDIQSTANKGKLVVAGVTVAALLASQLGFSNVVKYIYPLVGYGGFALLIILIYGKLALLKAR